MAVPSLSLRASVRLPWSRFQSPLIEPHVRISRTRLSDEIMPSPTQCCAPGREHAVTTQARRCTGSEVSVQPHRMRPNAHRTGTRSYQLQAIAFAPLAVGPGSVPARPVSGTVVADTSRRDFCDRRTCEHLRHHAQTLNASCVITPCMPKCELLRTTELRNDAPA